MGRYKFKVGDIVEAINPFCTYKVIEVRHKTLKVVPNDKDLSDIEHICSKSTFKKSDKKDMIL